MPAAAASSGYTVGQRVRFTADNLGGLAIDADTGRPYFVERHYNAGEEGEVLNTELPDGWLAVWPDERPEGLLYVPVHPGMIEAA